MTTDNVAVLGFGTMGSGIADACARAGFAVTVLEQDEAGLEAGRAALRRFHAAGIKRGRLDPAVAEEIEGRITGTTEVAALAGCAVVIEAVTEDEDLKAAVLARVAGVVGDDAVLATNTSAISVTRLAAALPHPERVGGLHFFNPAALMPLVEVVRALQTSETTVARLVDLATRLGKHPIVVRDRPGFLVNALLLPYLNHAIRELDEGLAAPDDLDRAVELGLGYPNGPLRALDLIGLDTHLAATEAVYAATLDGRYAPPPLLVQMVAAGRLGRKSGSGFVTKNPE